MIIQEDVVHWGHGKYSLPQCSSKQNDNKALLALFSFSFSFLKQEGMTDPQLVTFLTAVLLRKKLSRL